MARNESVRKSTRSSHRAQFPTPGFYLFAFILNLISLPISGLLLSSDFSNVTLLTLAGLSVLALAVSIYSATLKPMASNKGTRKILVTLSVAFGFFLLVAIGFNVLMNPALIA